MDYIYNDEHGNIINIEIQRVNDKARISRLKVYRDRLGLTQTELAKKSNVNTRMIQYYEQFQKNINHAKADTILNLSQALNCHMEDLMEPDTKNKDDEE